MSSSVYALPLPRILSPLVPVAGDFAGLRIQSEAHHFPKKLFLFHPDESSSSLLSLFLMLISSLHLQCTNKIGLRLVFLGLSPLADSELPEVGESIFFFLFQSEC